MERYDFTFFHTVVQIFERIRALKFEIAENGVFAISLRQQLPTLIKN